MEKHLLELLSKLSDEEADILGGESLNKKIYSSGDKFIINNSRLFGSDGDIGVRTHTRYTAFPTHKHNYVEMMIVLQGCVRHNVDDEIIELSRGEILMLNKHMPHSIERSGEGDIGVNIIMSDRFISSMSAELSGTVFSSLMKENAKPDGKPMYLYFTSADKKYITNTIEDLLFELTGERADVAVMSKTVSLLLTYLSLENEELLKSGSEPQDKESRRKMEIVSYIKTNYRTASLTELGDRLYLSTPYLSKAVKLYFGKSFKELVVEQRLETAKHLLTTSSMPIGDIIRAVGYENESYFHRAFKARFGMAPLQIRKAAL